LVEVSRCAGLLLVGAIFQHLDVFERDQSFQNHFVQVRQQAFDVFFRIDDLDDRLVR